jgi:hypothetical protein
MTGDKGALSIGLQVSYTALEGHRQQAVISVKKDQILTRAVAQARIPSRREALIVLPDIMDRLIIGSNVGCAISLAIIDHNNFKSLITLRQNALNRLIQKMGLVITRNNNGNEWIFHTWRPIRHGKPGGEVGYGLRP